MKEQTQLIGVRKYFGDDFLSIQNEMMEAQEAYFAPYGNCIIKGCEVAGQDIAPGICYIGGKIVRFAGTVGIVSFPVYLKLDESISKTREYQTGGVKEIEREFKAVLSTIIPSGDYLTINSTGGKTFRAAFQDANNRMVSDADISNWNGKLNAAAKAADSDKVDGFDTSTASTVNTVAIRDAAGKLTAVDFIPTSDRRLKDEVNYDLSGVSIDGLKPVSFKINGHFRYGFIAQDMKVSHPQLVMGTGKEKVNGEIDYLSIKETSIYALLVKEVQELKETVNQLKERRINIFKRLTNGIRKLSNIIRG